MRETLTNLETRLNPEQFIRISRSAIINADRIREIQPLFNGDFVVILGNGEAITGSRRYRDKLDELIR